MMSNKSGTSSQIISLPNGGGALQGIGETFSPDLFTGTGNFSVPIALPAGRNGFQPSLKLVYSTGNGNGPFGLGWGLDVPGVSRKTAKGVPRYDDVADTFILSGAEDLVPVERSATWTRYRPRTEGLFARIFHHRDAGNDFWEVRSKDGLVSIYGTPGAAGNDPATVADPADRSNIFTWRLSRTTDPFGNTVRYAFLRDPGAVENRRWDQLYLGRIDYVDYTVGQQNRFLVAVRFTYENRPDPFSGYRSGFEVRTRKRCSQIAVQTHPDREILVRTYDLVYLDQRRDIEDLDARQPVNNVSLLNRVSVTGHDAGAAEALPPLEFDYTRFEPQSRDFFPLEGSDLPARSLGHPDLELADLSGNGLPDIVEINGGVRYWRNLGSGRFDLPRTMRDAPAGLRLGDPEVQLMDVDGNGRIDLLVHQNGMSGCFALGFNGEWDRRSYRRFARAPTFSLADPEVKLVDLDGDGATDIIRSGNRLECFFNDPENGGWTRSRFVRRRSMESFPDISFSDPRVKLADMSGDGLQDIVLVHDGNIEYWPNLGHGNWGPRIHMQHSPRFRDAGYAVGYDPLRVLIGDVDGDGLADLIYVDDRRVTLWINQGGDGWSTPMEIDGTPPVSDMDAVRLVDLLGTGTAGVLWSADADGSTRPHLFFLDFTGGVKPYLLHTMNNHMGAVTRVAYAPSTRFYLSDVRRPETRWRTPLPFPVQVVARVEVVDEISMGKLTTEYRYRHGYWDGAEREFRGFGMVEQRDTETFENYHARGLHMGDAFSGVAPMHFSPPTQTRTWFHQGPVGEAHDDWYEADYSHEFWSGDPSLLEREPALVTLLNRLPRRDRRDALRALRGLPLRTELYALDGSDRENRPYSVSESGFSLREESAPGANDRQRRRIFFPYVAAQRTTQWERGDDPMTQFSFTENYDPFGQPRRQTQIACPRGWRRLDDVPGPAYLATRTETTYAHPADPRVFITNRVAGARQYEIINNGGRRLMELKNAPADSPALSVIGLTLNFYDGAAFQGLPNGEIGLYGSRVRTETLMLTDAMLHEGYKSGNRALNPPEMPPYMTSRGPPAWSAEYPREFRDRLPPLAGYTHHAGGAGSPFEAGYYAATGRRGYDFQINPAGPHRGLLAAMRDPFGNDSIVNHDAYDFMPVNVTDTVGLRTMADYDYRVFQPRRVTDPNGNRRAFGFTPLGLPAWIAVMGKAGEPVGDTPETPGIRFTYGFMAFRNSPRNARQPVFVRSERRAHHVNDLHVTLPEREATFTTVEYSDGFGRLLQTRTQAEDERFGDGVFGNDVLPADLSDRQGTGADIVGRSRSANGPDNVVVSGWQRYDNKGRVVEKTEPFFSTGWNYLPPGARELGQWVTMVYDPRGQVVRTIHPDGAEQRVVFGVPPDLTDPGNITPTPWETYTYDANDNAGRTHAAAAQAYRDHWNTPSSGLFDALGRIIETVARNGPDPANDWYVTRSTYDIRGNLLGVVDPLGRTAFSYVYDMADRPLRIESMDAGLRRMVPDAAGKEIERRGGKGAVILQAHDPLQRAVRLWARDAADEPMTLRERRDYGDGGNANQDAGARAANRNANRLGRLYRHYDEAGRVTMETYDFKGNATETRRRVIGDGAILGRFNTPGGVPPPNWQVPVFRADWQPPAGTHLDDHANALLDAIQYQVSADFDALNRLRSMQYPQDAAGERKILRPRYNRGGNLERVELDGTAFATRIAYNAKGQRTFIAFDNGVMTRYAYHSQTFRLVRLRTEHASHPAPLAYRPTGSPLQDMAYGYDVAGNITAIRDRAPAGGIPNTRLGTDALNRDFTYDPLYRLLSATGRECDIPPDRLPWEDTPRCTDVSRTRGYIERYGYDRAGNLTRLLHLAVNGGFTRTFNPAPGSNRLVAMTIGNGFNRRHAYAQDANGNLIGENSDRHFQWDHKDRMKAFYNQVNAAEPSQHAHYLYDAGGQRVKKLVRRQGGDHEVTVTIDGIFEHHIRVRGNNRHENNTLHIMDDVRRIAVVRVGPAFPGDNTPPVQYHLADHLGGSNVVIDAAGAWINREEYTPYGETSFGGFARKRFRFSGKERDKESGLYYHGARYYAPWYGKWISCDPLGAAGGTNAYAAFFGNPMSFRDPSGMEPEVTPDMVFKEKRLTKGSSRPDRFAREEQNRTEQLESPWRADERSVSGGRTIFEPNLRVNPQTGRIVVLGPLPVPDPVNDWHPPSPRVEPGEGTRGTGAGEGKSVDIGPLKSPQYREPIKKPPTVTNNKTSKTNEITTQKQISEKRREERVLEQLYATFIPQSEFKELLDRYGGDENLALQSIEESRWKITRTIIGNVDPDAPVGRNLTYFVVGAPDADSPVLVSKSIFTPYDSPDSSRKAIKALHYHQAAQLMKTPLVIHLKE